METLNQIIILTQLSFVAIDITRVKDLLAVAMLLGVYGLLSASFLVAMDAVDVAFTEASVGAGISTILMLIAVTMTDRNENAIGHKYILAMVLVVFTAGLLVYGTLDMPYYGLAEAPANLHVSPRYIYGSMQEIGIPNIVTSVLASYRGFDTFGEVVVIFTAGIGVLVLLSVPRRRKEDEGEIKSANIAMHEQHLVLRVIMQTVDPVYYAVCTLCTISRGFWAWRRISGRRNLRRSYHTLRNAVRLEHGSQSHQPTACSLAFCNRCAALRQCRGGFNVKRWELPGLQRPAVRPDSGSALGDIPRRTWRRLYRCIRYGHYIL